MAGLKAQKASSPTSIITASSVRGQPPRKPLAVRRHNTSFSGLPAKRRYSSLARQSLFNLVRYRGRSRTRQHLLGWGLHGCEVTADTWSCEGCRRGSASPDTAGCWLRWLPFTAHFWPYFTGDHTTFRHSGLSGERAHRIVGMSFFHQSDVCDKAKRLGIFFRLYV